jgi:hypothetical protein
MSAIDNKHLIEIIAVNLEGGTTKNGPNAGKPWEMRKAQCVIKGPDNSVKVGVLTLPKVMQEPKPGRYLAEFELGIDFDNKVIPLLTALHPFDNKNSSTPAAAAAPK